MNHKLKKALRRILELEPNFELDMGHYEHKNECGSTYCIVGRLAHLDGYPEQYDSVSGYRHGLYSEELTSCSAESETWNFIFNGSWSNSLEQAKERAKVLLLDPEYAENNEWTYEDNFKDGELL